MTNWRPEYSNVLMGIDNDPDVVANNKAAGRNVVLVDATDDEMWPEAQVEIVIMALKDHNENLGIVKGIRERGGEVKVFAVASHQDEVEELVDAGASAAWNMYSEAGVGLASEVVSYYRSKEMGNQ